MQYLMGIDLGSTSLKAIIYDLDGNAVAAGSRPTEKFHPDAEHPDWTVWMPEQIFGGTADAIREAISQLDDPRDVKAVAVTGMGMDGVPLDAEGNWLYPLISWHCPRTVPQLEWWKEHIGAEKSFAIGGNPLWHICTALRILWMAEHEPEILAATDKWLLIEDFMNFMLCGRRATDYSMASNTLLFDQHRLAWSDEMLAASGIDRRLLADPYPSGTVLGEVTAKAAAATGLAEGTPVVLGGHDHICGTLPVGAFEPGVVLDVTGTWESVLIAMTEPNLTPEFQKAGMMVQAHVARGRYSAAGATVAADMLEWYRRHFHKAATAGRAPDSATAGRAPDSATAGGAPDSATAGGAPDSATAGRAPDSATAGGATDNSTRDDSTGNSPDNATDWSHLMSAAAASPPGARRVMFLPHMSGVSCPVVDEKSLGALVGLSSRATAGDVLRAMIEGLDYQFLDIVTTIESNSSARLERFIAVGGATRNEFWMQNKADVIGRPIEVPAIEEATPLGAAILAGIGIGLYADEQTAFHRVYKPGKTYHPDPNLSKQYAARFKIYRQLYPALRRISHQLSSIP